jgi:cytochrome P450
MLRCAQIITFLIAGHDSTASAMSGFLLEVTANPRVEALLLKEIDAVVGDGDVRWEHLHQLTYLSWCQKEALRLHPPVTRAHRMCASEASA